jgi:hypothetical protein
MRIAAFVTALVIVSGGLRAQDARPFDAAQGKSLPEFKTLYNAVRQNLTEAEKVAYLYSFKERRTDVHTNPFGKIGTGGTRVFEVYPSPTRQLTYRRLIERGGVAVGAHELAEQDRQYRTRVMEVQRRLAAENGDPQRQREEAVARARRRGQTAIEDVVDTLQFKIEGRAMKDGVHALVVTFTPQPDAKPATREGRIAQKFAGTAWVNEEAAEVLRVEAKAVDDISFGFGIVARLGEGTTATLVRRPVEGGVWMPTELRLNGRGRAALVRKLVIDFAIDWFDYRRMQGDSQTPFLDK